MLFNTLILITSFSVLSVSLVLFSKAAGTISPLKLNTISYVLYFQLITSAFVGSILVVTNTVDYHYMVSKVSEEVKFYAWVGVMYSFLALPLSMIALNKLLGIKVKKHFNKYIHQPTIIKLGSGDSKIILLFMVMFSILIIAYVFYYSESIPLIDLLQGNIVEAALGRVEVRRNFDGIVYIKNIFGYMFIPVCSYYSYIIYKIRRSNFNLFILGVLVFLSFLMLAYDIQKAPVAFYFLGFAILNTLLEGGMKIRKFLAIILVGILLIIIGYSLTDDKGLFQLFSFKSAFWSRTFVSSYGGYLLSLEYFPDIITQPTWQIGLPTVILDIFDLPKTESARLLMKQINPSGVSSGESNIISSYYLGEAWANYGIIGILFAPLIVGVVVQTLHIFLLFSKKEPLVLAFYAFMTTEWLLMSGFVNILYLKQLLYPISLLVLIKLCINTLKKL